MTFEPGQMVDERFQVIRRLGGNMHSSTCQAICQSTDQEVVLKKLHHESDQGMQQQLHQAQQAQLLSGQCDEILTIDQVSVEEDHAYYSMPYLPARSLKRHKTPTANKKTETEGEPYFAEDFDWLSRIAKALDFLADNNQIHGDVKPTNILFTNDDGVLKAYLSDIEIAKPKSKKNGGKVKDEYPGTMAYLAREVFLAQENASSRSDQYALAVTLYEWLAGELPFKGVTGIDMYKAFQKGFTPINEICPELPPSSVNALHRALSEEPEQRFETSGEFAAAFIDELPVRQKGGSGLNWQMAGNALLFLAASLLLFLFARDFFSPNEQEATNDLRNQPVQRKQTIENANVGPGTAEKKLANSQTDLAKRQTDSARPEKNSKQVFESLLLAAQQNPRSGPALYKLANAYEKGIGCDPDFPKAFKLYQASAEQGEPLAQFRLGQIYQKGVDNPGCTVIKPDSENAKRWYRKAADGGLADAQFQTGRYFEIEANQIRPQNRIQHNAKIRLLEQAYEQYEKAASQDRIDVARYLAEFCNKYQDIKKAQEWNQRANELERRAGEAETYRNQQTAKQKKDSGQGTGER